MQNSAQRSQPITKVYYTQLVIPPRAVERPATFLTHCLYLWFIFVPSETSNLALGPTQWTLVELLDRGACRLPGLTMSGAIPPLPPTFVYGLTTLKVAQSIYCKTIGWLM